MRIFLVLYYDGRESRVVEYPEDMEITDVARDIFSDKEVREAVCIRGSELFDKETRKGNVADMQRINDYFNVQINEIVTKKATGETLYQEYGAVHVE